MPAPKGTLKERLAHYHQIKISVIGRMSGQTISIPVWLVLEGEKLYLLPVQGSATVVAYSGHFRRRNWGRPMPPAPVLAAEFELRARHLQLTPEMYTSSAKLRTWCEQNRNRCYVPEWLLKEWGFTVDLGFNDAA